MPTKLKLDFCSYDAAKMACQRWHYSRRMPAGKLCKIGVWENDKFIGVVIYGLGSGSSTNGTRYGLAKMFEVLELQRVALKNEHTTPTSKIVAISIKIIKKTYTKAKLLISFADSLQGHKGIIYRASNWLFVGLSESVISNYLFKNKRVPARTIYARYGTQSLEVLRKHDPKVERLKEPPKYRYIYPLDADTAKLVEKFKQPYPCDSGVMVTQQPIQADDAGASPSGSLTKVHYGTS